MVREGGGDERPHHVTPDARRGKYLARRELGRHGTERARPIIFCDAAEGRLDPA
jgi:hypothetical protein